MKFLSSHLYQQDSDKSNIEAELTFSAETTIIFQIIISPPPNPFNLPFFWNIDFAPPVASLRCRIQAVRKGTTGKMLRVHLISLADSKFS